MLRDSSSWWASFLTRVIAVASATLVATAHAETTGTLGTPSSVMLTLVRNVLDTNPEITVQRRQVEIAKARLGAAKAALLPTVEANGLVQRREIDVKQGGAGDAKFVAGQASIEGRLRVYDGNRTLNAIQVAKQELASAEAVLDATISDVLLQLLTAAADVHRDRKLREYTELQSDAIAEQLRATSRRLEFAESTTTDENLAKARLATSRAGILAATEELNVSGYRFRHVSGQSATIVPPLPELAAVPGSLTQAQSLATAANPKLRAAQRNADAAKIGVNFAAGALMPQLDAVGGYEYLTGGVANLFTGKLPEDRSAVYGGIELRVPVFQPRDYAEIRRARAVNDQRLAQTDVAVRTIIEDVASAWTRWQSAKSTIAVAEAAVAATSDAAEGIRKESVGGNRTLVEVLDAQNELLSARVTLERSVHNEFVARAQLLAATGSLKSESILEQSAFRTRSVSTRPQASLLGTKPPVAASQSSESTSEQGAVPARDLSTRPGVSSLGRKANPALPGASLTLTEKR